MQSRIRPREVAGPDIRREDAPLSQKGTKQQMMNSESSNAASTAKKVAMSERTRKSPRCGNDASLKRLTLLAPGST